MAELATSLERLAALATRLNSESNEVNILISSVEQKLGSANLGLSVWLGFRGGSPVLVGDPTPTDPVIGEQLGYGKVGEKWRLCVRTVSVTTTIFEDDPHVDVRPIGEPRPLLEASRLARVQACGYLTLLVDTLADEAQGLLQGIERAKAAAP